MLCDQCWDGLSELAQGKIATLFIDPDEDPKWVHNSVSMTAVVDRWKRDLATENRKAKNG